MPRQSELVAMPFPRFLDHMRERWQPGQHVGVCAPTGGGKSTLVAGLLSLRRYVLAFDPKGGDEILRALGWERLEEWPGTRRLQRMVARDEERGRPSRYVVGPVVHTTRDRATLKEVISRATDGLFDMGGWTAYYDELQVASDRRMMALEGQIAGLLVTARQPKRISVVGSFQAPSWVPTEATRQPTWFVTGYTRDRDVVERLAAVMGRDYHEVQGAMYGLEQHMFMVVDRDPDSPIILTKPRYIA